MAPTLQTLEITALRIKESHSIPATSGTDLRARFLLAFRAPVRSSDRQRNSRESRVHRNYSTALQKGCHFFLCFALCITPRACETPEASDLLIYEDASKYQFTLKSEIVALFENWAAADGYDSDPAHVGFIESLAPGSVEYATEDIQTVKRIILQRGLDEAFEVMVMNILFPNCTPPDNDPFEEQD
jgi:hypothetical protein